MFSAGERVVVRTERVKVADLWRIGEFRALWIAETGSVFGDQLARVALSLLVFAQTSSALLTGLTYALTFVPAILGGLFLSSLADRYPRRRVIIVTDLVRAALAASMAIPGLPLGVLWTLVGLLALANAPFKAAQLAILPQILQGAQYSTALAMRQMTSQTAQVVGFALGGVVVTILAPQGALLLNAATFLASVALVVTGVRERPAPRQDTSSTVDRSEEKVNLRNGHLVPIFIAVCLTGLWVVPEGLAAPYSAALGPAVFAVGLLMAADPLGSVLGAWLAAARPKSSPTLLSVMLPAFAAGIPLMVCAARPGLVLSVVLWGVSGAFSTVFLVRMQEYVTWAVDDSRRGTVMGRVSACLYSSQGVAILGGGVLADVRGPFVAVGAAGALATAVVAVLTVVWRRARPPRYSADEHESVDEDKAAGQISLLRIASSGGRRGEPDAGGDDNAGAPPGNGSLTSMSTDAPKKQPPRRGGVLNVRGWALWAKPSGGALFLTLVDALAIGLSVFAFLASTPTGADVWMAVGLCVLGLGAAEFSIRAEQMRRWLSDAPRTPHVNLTSVWTMAAALVLHPGLAAAVVIVLYVHLWIRIWRQLSQVQIYRWLFNVANVVLCCHVTAWFVQDAIPSGVTGTAAELLWLLAAVGVYFVVNSVLAAVAIATLQSDWSLRRLLGTFDDNTLELATLCMGALVALLFAWKPWLAPLVLLPMYRLHRSVLTQDYEIAATVDGKTGVLNAVSWNVRAKKELDRARRHDTRLSILMIDIDHFKRANNKHGHLVGDRALQEVAKTLEQETRSYDCVGRFGGDEFSVVLTSTDRRAAEEVGNRICEKIRELHIDAESGSQRLSVSIGVATFPHNGGTLEDLLKSADVALFAAKDSGRDQVRSSESV